MQLEAYSLVQVLVLRVSSDVDLRNMNHHLSQAWKQRIGDLVTVYSLRLEKAILSQLLQMFS